MNTVTEKTIQRQQELGTIISAYNQATDSLKQSHDRLRGEVRGLREELKRKNEQLRRRERLAALGEMAAGLAHEIRNPLGAIQLLASMLRDDLKDRAKAAQLVDRILRNTHIMESLVADVLAFGRYCKPRPSRVDLAALLAETIELASARPARTKTVIQVSRKVDGISLLTDANMLQRALLNLIINALEASWSAGRHDNTGAVQVDLIDGRPDYLTITVSDRGPGISPDVMERIFNPFFTTKDQGTGLGLAIVHQIAEALGGSIKADNKSTGGAVFSLRLPKRLSAGGCELVDEPDPHKFLRPV